MACQVPVALVGVGGFGQTYVNAFLDSGDEQGAALVAAIDPDPSASPRAEEMTQRGVTFHGDLDAFYASGSAALVVIAAPIHFHAPFACRALAAGSSVLCEKPLAGSVPDGLRMVAAADANPGFLAVGYQWSFSDAVHALKADILSGRFGRPVRLKTYCCWPRTAAYYSRNNWAGRVQMPDGAWVQDSPVNNAVAHYLHNMFYVLGRSRETSARPTTVQAELYRAKPVESYDTAAIRCQTDCGAEVLFYATHSDRPRRGPVSHFEFANAVVTFDVDDGGNFQARLADGTTRDYGNPEATRENKIWQSVRAVRTGDPVACDAAAALSQTLCMAAALESSPIVPLPDDGLGTMPHDDSEIIVMPGLREALDDCYQQSVLPSDLDLPWARAGREVVVPSAAG